MSAHVYNMSLVQAWHRLILVCMVMLLCKCSLLFISCFPSQAVVVDRTMYISGQLGMDAASGQLVEGGVQAQTKRVTAQKTLALCV